MTNRNRATPETLQRRIEAFEKGTCSTHWPHDFSDHSLGKGSLDNMDYKYTPVELTNEIKSLI